MTRVALFGNVIALEELAHVLDLRVLDILVRADHRRIIRMGLGKSWWYNSSSTRPYGAFSTLWRRRLRHDRPA